MWSNGKKISLRLYSSDKGPGRTSGANQINYWARWKISLQGGNDIDVVSDVRE